MNRFTLATAGVIAAAITLTACAPSDDGASSGSGAGFNDQDVMFAQMMVPHHEQAVEMSQMILDKDGIDERVIELAVTIEEQQQPEIEQLNGWLDEWDVAADDMGGMDHSGGMSGMMSDEQMQDLDSASGDTAEILFLEQMTEHHNGAIEMAEAEVEAGEYADAVALAEDIVETQQSEVDEMNDILATL